MAATLATIDAAGTPASHRLQIINWPLPVTNVLLRAQLLFCDLSTPKNDGNFNVYEDIRKKLIAAGVPENEIEFIHNADTEAKKAALFSKVRSGDVRVLLGSTAKMGAGTNVQQRLVAVHHLDVGWKPSDMTQRNGRIIRQGNMNKEVKVFNYVTEGTFDSYLFQTLENKQRFIRDRKSTRLNSSHT